MGVIVLKKLLQTVAAFSVLFVLGSSAHAATYGIPLDLNGRLPSDANLVGVDVIDSTAAAPTVPYGIAAPCFLHWVAISSAALAEVAVLRDTDTLNSTSDIKMTLVTKASGTGVTTEILTFNPPIIFRNGLSIKLNVNATGRWMFGYRRRLDNDISTDPAVGNSASD